MRSLVLLAIVGAALWGAPGAFAAGWCGTGESSFDLPDIVTGPQVHVIYAIPSDSVDTFATDVPKLADDIASITAWWQGQDPTRIPRFDVALFNGVTCPDISFVRLPDPISSWFDMGAGGAFNNVRIELAGLGFDDPYKIYYVYFGGPEVEHDVCGTGFGQFNLPGPGDAVIWAAGCPGIPTDAIGAHELLHALGALPAGAPNACTAANNPLGAYADFGHPCDSPTDVLYPVSSGQPLSALVLDYNNDDYYAHTGTWDDIQDSFWLHRLDVPPVALTVDVSGVGSVKSAQSGVDCAASCTTEWDLGSPVLLTPYAARQSHFIGWSGACTGSVIDTCALTLASPAIVTAVFGPARISVAVSAAGKGRVTCSPTCSHNFLAGTSLLLRAVPTKGWKFAHWSGACKGTHPTCRPATNYTLSAHATFTKLKTTPKPTKR